MKPRVRVAPSPTGFLHIGVSRTALFNWLFARHHGGTFLLRIEDTDRERSTKEFETSIFEGLSWLGLTWDEEPLYQSQRNHLYTAAIQKLCDEGKAYPCTCTAEELEAKRVEAMARGEKPKYDGTCRNGPSHPGRPAAIRFRSPQEGQTTFHDLCRGSITFEKSELDDLIIARSDGAPTYNFVVVIDDMSSKISHVIRGDDHINNTPRQIQLYEALGYPVPQFAHLPMIHGPDRKKLSKRHGALSLLEYRDMGYLPDAMVNYLARLGWGHGDQEIFSREELINAFDINAVSSSPSIFDMEKLNWVNSQHLMKKNGDELVTLVAPFLKRQGVDINDTAYAAKALVTERERAKTLKELSEVSAFFFRHEVTFDGKAVQEWLDPQGKEVLKKIFERLEALDVFTAGSIKTIFEAVMKDTGLKMVKLAQPIRVALTGTTVSPGIYEVLEILGKERSLARIKRALTHEN